MTKRTLENLAGLNAKARGVFEQLLTAIVPVLNEFGARAEIISGLRSWQQQAALFAQGRTRPGRVVTKAPPGSSWHNYGLAVDFGLFKDGVYLDEKQPALADRIYQRIAEKARALGIEWAGDWTRFRETPHFQYRPGIANIAAARKKFLAVGMDVQKMLD